VNARELIEAKKQGRELGEAEIAFVVKGFTAGTLPD